MLSTPVVRAEGRDRLSLFAQLLHDKWENIFRTISGANLQ